MAYTYVKPIKTIRISVINGTGELEIGDDEYNTPYASQALAAFLKGEDMSFENGGAMVTIPFHAVDYIGITSDGTELEKADAYYCDEEPAPTDCETLLSETLEFITDMYEGAPIIVGESSTVPEITPAMTACPFRLTIGDTIYENGRLDDGVILFLDSDENLRAAIPIYGDYIQIMTLGDTAGDYSVTLEVCCSGETKYLDVSGSMNDVTILDGSDFADCSEILAWLREHTENEVFDDSCIIIYANGQPDRFSYYHAEKYFWDGFYIYEVDGECVMGIQIIT